VRAKVPATARERKAAQLPAKQASSGASNELRERRAGVIKSAKDETKRRRLGLHGKKSQ
jgi:hypothetical protein